jgi:hypothetical protein
MAMAACPRGERPWIDAMFAELGAIDGPGRRFGWMMGAASVVFAVIHARATTALSGRLRSLMVLALCAAALSGVGSLVGWEGLGIDDDAFLALACLCSVLLLALGALAFGRIFRSPDALAGGRR